jgi:hypothetical protein
MSKKIFLGTVVASLFSCVSAFGQEMPAGNVIVNTACQISEGYTFADAVAVAREANITTEDGPNLIFYRQPIAGAGAYPANALLRVVYWDNLAHWARSAASRATAVTASAGGYLNEIVTCDNVNRSFFVNRNVGQGAAYANGENNETLVSSRACEVAPGNTIEDVYAGLTALNAPYGEQGNTTLMQLSQRFMGPREGQSMGANIIIRLIGEDGVGLAERIDMAGKPAGLPDDAPVANCADLSLWASHVIHWGI